MRPSDLLKFALALLLLFCAYKLPVKDCSGKHTTSVLRVGGNQ